MNITGIKYPLGLHNGRVMLSTGEQHVKESIMQILGTGKGEYLMKPDFGSGLPARVFDPVNVMALAQGDVVEAIRIWEPRAEIRRVTANVDPNEQGVVTLSVEFTLKGQEQPVQANLTIGK
jgi:phage baseplate assembly protein W